MPDELQWLKMTDRPHEGQRVEDSYELRVANTRFHQFRMLGTAESDF